MTLLGYFWDRWTYFEGKLSWNITTTEVNSALHPSGVAKSSTSFDWGIGGKVTSAGWQVTLCDPIWHVISRSGVVISITNCYIRVYFTLYQAFRHHRDATVHWFLHKIFSKPTGEQMASSDTQLWRWRLWSLIHIKWTDKRDKWTCQFVVSVCGVHLRHKGQVCRVH